MMKGTLTLLCVIAFTFNTNIDVYSENSIANAAFRMDDAQDITFRDQQLAIYDIFIEAKIPLTVGVISGYIGEDKEIVDAIKRGYDSGLFELAHHGFGNENHSQLNYNEQEKLVSNGLVRIKTIFGEIKLNTFIPPMFEYNEDTIRVCENFGFNIISSYIFYGAPEVDTSLEFFHETVQTARYENAIFFQNNKMSIMNKTGNSIEDYGYAVLTFHPQQISSYDKEGHITGVNETKVFQLNEIVTELADSYSFTTISGLGGYSWTTDTQSFRFNIFMIMPFLIMPIFLIGIMWYIKKRFRTIPSY